MSTMVSYENFENLLKAQGEYVTQVNGVSMYPMLRYRRDPIHIIPAGGMLKPYDVAVYRRDDRYVVHRVLSVGEDFYVIRGDNCDNKEYVPFESIRGVVDGFWRNSRYIPVTDKRYLIYSHLWVAINPLVRLHHKVGLPRNIRRVKHLYARLAGRR